MAQSSLEYWRQREAAQRDKNITEEAEYEKHIQKIYADTLDRVNKEINGFFVKYATKEGITIAEAKRRVSKLDIKEYSEKAKRYVEEKNFSEKANEEMRLYNLTMKVNRLELLKANIGLELIDGFSQLENYEGKILNDRTLAEMERQAGILGETVLEPAKKAHAIVNASFHNAQFSDRIWMYQDMLKSELSILLTRGLIQGLNPRQLAVDIKKRFGVSLSNATRLMRTEMARVQIGAQKQSYERNGYEEYEFIALTGHACEDCQALDGKHFKVIKMQPGLNAPPMHPNCKCSTAGWMDREAMERELFESDNSYMSRRADIGEWPQPGEKITENELKKLVEYGQKHNIDVKSFDNYDGDIELIKAFIDSIVQVAADYPEILNGKRMLQLRCSYQMAADDYAETTNNCIVINGNAFRNLQALKEDYEAQQMGDHPFFVKGTSYQNIAHHEVGHLIIKKYGLSPKRITEGLDLNRISIYGSDDPKEAIAESFSAHYADAHNEVTLQIKLKCDNIIAERRAQK